MFSFFFNKRPPLLDDASRQWLDDCFAWAKQHFDASYFKQHSPLVLPDNSFYPGRVASVHEMATNMFNYSCQHAGMQNWPINFVEPGYFKPGKMPLLSFENSLRGKTAKPVCGDYSSQGSGEIMVTYHPGQINQPQDFIATTAQNLATMLINQVKVLPPGGQDYMKQAIDFVACFLGFGVIMANTAYQFKGGCGSCNNASLNRQSALSEHETLYALALFCQEKGIEMKTAARHLKSHLRKDAKHIANDLIKNKQLAALASS